VIVRKDLSTAGLFKEAESGELARNRHRLVRVQR